MSALLQDNVQTYPYPIYIDFQMAFGNLAHRPIEPPGRIYLLVLECFIYCYTEYGGPICIVQQTAYLPFIS